MTRQGRATQRTQSDQAGDGVSRTVFISHAIGDPDWPDAAVMVLAERLQQRGARVLLDLLEDQAAEAKLSAARWREWMRQCLEQADHVLCLCSAKYAKLARRNNVKEPTGRGIAYEAFEIEARIYKQKQNNKGWVWILKADGSAPEKVIPDFLQGRCPEYGTPSEKERIIQDLTRLKAAAKKTGGIRQPPTVTNPEPEPVQQEGKAAAATPDLKSIHERVKQRLQDRAAVFQNKNVFGEKLWERLQKKFPDLVKGQVADPGVVADCFAEVQVDSLQSLFMALRKACEAVPKPSQMDTEVLIDLLVLVSMRAVDISLWCRKELWQGRKPGVCVHEVSVPNALLAAVGFAGLLGMTFRIGRGSAPHGVIDISSAVKNAEVPRSLLCALYDKIFDHDKERDHPLDKLSGTELGKLQLYFADLQDENEVTTVYVQMPEQNSETALRALTQLAGEINSRVVLGNESYERLTLPRVDIPPQALVQVVDELLHWTGSAVPTQQA